MTHSDDVELLIAMPSLGSSEPGGGRSSRRCPCTCMPHWPPLHNFCKIPGNGNELSFTSSCLGTRLQGPTDAAGGRPARSPGVAVTHDVTP